MKYNFFFFLSTSEMNNIDIKVTCVSNWNDFLNLGKLETCHSILKQTYPQTHNKQFHSEQGLQHRIHKKEKPKTQSGNLLLLFPSFGGNGFALTG